MVVVFLLFTGNYAVYVIIKIGFSLCLWQVNTSFDKSEIREVISINRYLADILFAGKISKVLKNLNPRLIELKRHRQDDRRCKFHVFR